MCYPLCISVLAHFSWLLSSPSNIAHPPALPCSPQTAIITIIAISNNNPSHFQILSSFPSFPPNHPIPSIPSIPSTALTTFYVTTFPPSNQIKVTTHSNPQQQQEKKKHFIHSFIHSRLLSTQRTNTQSLVFSLTLSLSTLYI